MEGFLQVPKGGKWKDKSKRYFMVDAGRKALCSGKSDSGARGANAKKIPFQNITNVSQNAENPCQIDLTTKRKKYEFRAADENDAALWVESIREHIEVSLADAAKRSSLRRPLSAMLRASFSSNRLSVGKSSTPEQPPPLPEKRASTRSHRSSARHSVNHNVDPLQEKVGMALIGTLFVLISVAISFLTPSIGHAGSHSHKPPVTDPPLQQHYVETPRTSLSSLSPPKSRPSAGQGLKLQLILAAVVVVLVVALVLFAMRKRITKAVQQTISDLTPSFLKQKTKKKDRSSSKRISSSSPVRLQSAGMEEDTRKKIEEQLLMQANSFRARQQAVEKSIQPRAPSTRSSPPQSSTANPTSLAAAAAAIALSRRSVQLEDDDEVDQQKANDQTVSLAPRSSSKPSKRPSSTTAASSQKSDSTKKKSSFFGMLFGGSNSTKKKSSESKRSSVRKSSKRSSKKTGKLDASQLNLPLHSSSSPVTLDTSSGSLQGPAAKLSAKGAKYTKYVAMLKTGLPEGAVRNAMARDGVAEPRGVFDEDDGQPLYSGKADLQKQIKNAKASAPPRMPSVGKDVSQGGASIIAELRQRQADWGLASLD